MPKLIKKKSLCEASPEKCFWVHNGPGLKDLRELRSELDKMSDESFFHHVNNEKNDFANWIEYVFSNKALAGKLRKAGSKDEIKKVLDTFLKSA